ncbi:hypothetical protein OAP18_03095 [Gammaproteobacteria bacterium]|nr:hypothetical protein [Gammaproteobacteria bacterium]
MLNRTGMLLFVVIMSGPLSACSDNNTEESEPTGVIPQGQLQALERANELGDVLQQSDEERRRQMEENGL